MIASATRFAGAVIVLGSLGLDAQSGVGQAVPAPEHDRAAFTFNAALGVECSTCHATSDWTSDHNPTLDTARKMREMVDALNRTQLRGTGGITCWSCHEGHTRPPRLPVERWQAIRDRTFVGPLASASDSVKLGMSVYSASLGVTCDHCHTSDWKSDERPAYRMVARMSAMFDEFPKYMPASARTQCFMCHKGSTTPARAPK